MIFKKLALLVAAVLLGALGVAFFAAQAPFLGLIFIGACIACVLSFFDLDPDNF